MIVKKLQDRINDAILDSGEDISIRDMDDNIIWLSDEHDNAGILEVERVGKKTLIRGRDLNTDICFMRGRPITKKNVSSAIQIMIDWNSKDRHLDREYPVGWRKDEDEDEDDECTR